MGDRYGVGGHDICVAHCEEAQAVVAGEKEGRFMDVTLKVSGMHCPDCALKVEGALTSVLGVRSAKVSYLKKQAVVDLAESTELETLVTAVQKTGYGAAILNTGGNA